MRFPRGKKVKVFAFSLHVVNKNQGETFLSRGGASVATEAPPREFFYIADDKL